MVLWSFPPPMKCWRTKLLIWITGEHCFCYMSIKNTGRFCNDQIVWPPGCKTISSTHWALFQVFQMLPKLALVLILFCLKTECLNWDGRNVTLTEWTICNGLTTTFSPNWVTSRRCPRCMKISTSLCGRGGLLTFWDTGRTIMKLKAMTAFDCLLSKLQSGEWLLVASLELEPITYERY